MIIFVTRKQLKDGLRKQISTESQIRELSELVGVEKGRAEVFKKEADFWKEQMKYWQIEASKLSAQLQKIRRKAKATETAGQTNEPEKATPQLMTPQNPDYYTHQQSKSNSQL